MAGPHKVSIIIKCLNEEARIEQAIESALESLASVQGEVILADALSTDRTIELASKYPIRIVQLVSTADRSCGAGPQLGYQHSTGEYVYVLDADMILHRRFIDAAVTFLDSHPDVAAVGGMINERNIESLEYIARVKRNSAHMAAGEVDRLDMGGLYRRTAVEAAGYLSNKLLHSYEELDLAVRLRVMGWTIHRIAEVSADHFGHDKNPYALLKNRWKTKYINGAGEIIRYSFGKPWQSLLLRSLREAWLYAAFAAWNLFMVGVLTYQVIFNFSSFFSALAVLGFALPFAVLAFKKKSLNAGGYAYVSMLMSTLGTLRGLAFSPRQSSPNVSSQVIQ
ncbi:glycosyltransferase [Xylophilus sp. GOD-11R]|uniref:glycosyltransferase n=1 Tax=Xylophilus sp. GOD-11R TaxID=3089814 RepID=UPI00298CA864|nr:glycosyltransferase [Xylophilus sp. GOD-11R]WPB57912.1 glycosyltransferase [Xylophilus sp. GOD-11R]